MSYESAPILQQIKNCSQEFVEKNKTASALTGIFFFLVHIFIVSGKVWKRFVRVKKDLASNRDLRSLTQQA